MNVTCKLCGLIKVESRSEQGCVEEQPEQILDGFVALVDSFLLLQLGHDGVLWVNLHDLLGHHARSHGIVADNDLLSLVTKNFLHQLGQRLEFGLALLKLLSLAVIIDRKALLGAGLQFLAIGLLELLDGVFIDRIFFLSASKKGKEGTSAILFPVM